jgi:hypothetical protein
MVSVLLAAQAAADLNSHVALLASFRYSSPNSAREYIVNSHDMELSFIWYAI